MAALAHKALVDHLHRRRRRGESATAQALVGLKVHFISLVSNPANKRQFIIKALRQGGGYVVVQKSVRIIKASKRRRVVYGVVLAPDEFDGEQDTISKAEIEKAAYGFMQTSRLQQIDAEHDGVANQGFVAESWLVRKDDPLFPDETVGSWVVGIKVTDNKIWKRVEKGQLLGFSVAGVARRQPVKPPTGGGVKLNNESEAGPMAGKTDVKKGAGLAVALVDAVLEQEGFLLDDAGDGTDEDVTKALLDDVSGGDGLHDDTVAMLEMIEGKEGFVDQVVKHLKERLAVDEEMRGAFEGAGITWVDDADPGSADGDVEKALPSRSRRRGVRAPVEAEENIEKQTPLGERLSKARDAQDLTIAEMAEWADRSSSTMGAILKGEIENPPDEVLKALAPHLTGVSAKTLMKLRDDHVEAGVKKAGTDDGGDLEGVTLEIPVRREVTVEKAQAGEVADGAARASVVKYYGALDEACVEIDEAVGKGASFKERMLKNQLWTITSALSDALRDVLGDKLVKNKIKAVRMVVDEFVEWLEEQVGDAVKKEVLAEVASDENSLDAIQDVQGETLKAIEKQSRVLAAIGKRLVAIEKQHPGRQSGLGGEDVDEELAKANGQVGKGFKGLNISL